MFLIFNDSSQTDNLDIYRTNLRHIAGSVELRLWVISLLKLGSLPWQPDVVGCIWRIEFRRHSIDGVSVRTTIGF